MITADVITAEMTDADLEAWIAEEAFQACEAGGIEPITVDDLDNIFYSDAALAVESRVRVEAYATRDRLRAAARSAEWAARDAARVPAWQRIIPRATNVKRRRSFPRSVLARYPLTQPEDVCQRCGVVGAGPLELDHIHELHLGGPDHPHNLVRLCSRCHRAKPYLPELGDSFVEMRLAILAWVLARPNVKWWGSLEERATYRRMFAELHAR